MSIFIQGQCLQKIVKKLQKNTVFNCFGLKIQSIDVLGLPTIDDIRDSCIGIFKVNR